MPTFTATPVGQSFVDVEATLAAQNVAEVADQSETQPPPEAVEPTAIPPTPVPTEVVPPTPVPTEEPQETAITVTVQQNMNIRSGPGTSYPVVGAAKAGDTSSLVGRNEASTWVQVEYPPGSGSTAWVFAELVQISGDPTSVAIAQVAPPPAPPAQPSAPEPEPQPEQPAAPPPVQYQFTPTGWFASENAAIVHFKGRIRDEAGNLVNGYSVYLNNWAWSTISHPTGASYWYPEKGDGEWDVSGIGLVQGQGWWWLSVVRYECDFWAAFDSQCTQFTTLSEEIKIEVRTPEESVINADWVCHWDCDKGLYVEGFHR
jgi:hypothetical protein